MLTCGHMIESRHLLSKRISDRLLTVTARQNPLKGAFEFYDPHLLAERQELAGLLQTEGITPEQQAEIEARLQEINASLAEPIFRVKFRPATRAETLAMGERQGKASRAAYAPERKDHWLDYVRAMTDEILLDEVLESVGKGQRWLEANELRTPQQLVEWAIADVRKRFSYIRDLLPDETGQDWGMLLERTALEAQVLSYEDFVTNLQVHLTEPQLHEIATDEHPEKSVEKFVVAIMQAERERIALEFAGTKAEWEAKGRAKQEEHLISALIRKEADELASERYQYERLATCTLIAQEGAWEQAFDSADDIVALLDEQDPDVLLNNRLFLQWLGGCLQGVMEAEQNLAQVVASRSFRSDLVNLPRS